MTRVRAKFPLCGALLFASIMMIGGNARAGLIAVTLTPNPSNTVTNSTSFSLGYTFVANANESVTQLGYFANPTLLDSHDVGIFTTGGSLLASTTVTNADPLTTNFRFHAIAPLALTAGQSYVIAGVTGTIDPYTFNPTVFTTDPNVTYVKSAFLASTSLVFPTSTDGIVGYFGPNFQFDLVTSPSPVPEPTSIAMAGTAVVMGLAYRWRRRRAIASS